LDQDPRPALDHVLFQGKLMDPKTIELWMDVKKLDYDKTRQQFETTPIERFLLELKLLFTSSFAVQLQRRYQKEDLLPLLVLQYLICVWLYLNQ
jgi:hypothetical protein